MNLNQIAGGDCGRDDCPTIFTTDRGTVAVQGYPSTDRRQMGRPSSRSHWTCSRMPSVRLEGKAWRQFFDSFERDAFRLETLPRYGVASENEELQGFLTAGHWSSRTMTSGWSEYGTSGPPAGGLAGVQVLRQPLSDYLRYEFAVYDHTVRVGDDVRILDLIDVADPCLPSCDFWLLDEVRVVRMDYDTDGRQLGREWLEDADPSPYTPGSD
jgi:hypothetical protein